MSTLSSGNDDFEASATKMLETVQQQRTDLLGATIDIQVGIGLLAGVEADRLAQKYGEDDSRVQLLRDRSDAAAARVDALSVEQEIATVRTPPPSTTGALIQGRVTDMTQRAAGQVTVQLIDEKGKPVAGIEPVKTDAAGYFAFELTPETVKATQSKLSVLLRDADVQLVPVAAQPIAITPGATRVMDVSLSAAELERLRLRMPLAVDKTTVQVSAADPAVAMGKAAEDKNGVDKAVAETPAKEQAEPAKGAADKTGPAKTAAKKPTTEKAATDQTVTKPPQGGGASKKR